ncbi:hypothetical protein GR247_38145 [Rhizobium leguminosarum]|nr:hypothetical protein [Rhizobium leguminosarum]
MNVSFKRILVFSHLFLAAGGLAAEAHAQGPHITPLPLPDIGALPPAPDGAHASFDRNAVKLLTYLVEMSRQIGGGISQLFEPLHAIENLEAQTRDAAQAQFAALSGSRPFPVNNGEEDIAARKGGAGLWEMANAALSGGTVGPDDLQQALTDFRNRYHLNAAFALRDDKLVSNVNIAHSSAQGAVVASTAENAYKRADNSMSRISDYITALENSNDVKASIDLNTRVTIELVQQLNEILRTQAAIASVAGSHLMALGADAAETDSLSDLIKNFNR